ncbi:hypothetical protein B4N84_23875 [Flavobacterium sp. IR1]|nr:hypothetical protein B4N84_23875 [Flavobacterium sp. IR1]
MKKRLLLILTVLLFSKNITAQINPDLMISVFYKGESEKINNENSSAIYDEIYDMFEKYNAISEKASLKKFDEKEVFFKSNLSEEKLISCIDSLSKNSKLSLITQFKKQQLVLESNFPSFFQKNNSLDFVKINLRSFDAINENKKKIMIDSIHARAENSGTLLDKDLIYHTIKLQDNINISSKKATGFATYNVKILTDYAIQKLNKANLITTFSINKKEIKIIEIYNKIFVFDVLNESNDFTKKAENFNYWALDINNKNEIKWGSNMYYLIYKDVYNIFKLNRKTTKEELKKLLPVEKLQKMKENGFYNVIEHEHAFDNNILFYSKIYGISKDIKVKI